MCSMNLIENFDLKFSIIENIDFSMINYTIQCNVLKLMYCIVKVLRP